jgi:hypothetical protein
LVRYAVRLAREAGNLPIFRDASAQIGAPGQAALVQALDEKERLQGRGCLNAS